ncbi:VWA domain-containing protein [Bacillus sp. 31A1R]|uniref:VWA domain-containing protein n=1 Tax=Robertmurraya mangrovi TaxID=3098077 RepID=A0ABU5J4V7_9BACI|nr:VWA domain-containing protein [Bacillus sp. 31A1R]MDZ5474413.1 VWA domain-containing protein [Bacillus sp. 31A1R]
MLRKRLFLLLTCMLVLTACSSKSEDAKSVKQEAEEGKVSEETAEKQTEQKEQEVVPEPLPSTYEELASQPIGKFVNHSASPSDPGPTLELFKDLPDISNNPTQQQLDHFYRELVRLVQKEFKGLEEAFKQLKFQSIGNPEMEDERYQFKDQLNVEILLDASGSMANKIDGKVMMDSAKDAIMSFVQQLPEEANIGLRVYGHKGSGSDSDKQLSCESSELFYSISGFNKERFQTSLDKVKPAGWTPIELAINEAKEDLSQYDGTENTNIIYLVSDGVETCGGDPVSAAKELYDSNISPIINIIGFDVDSEGENQLKEMAKATEGIYQRVNDESELKRELDKIAEIADMWKDWKEQNQKKIDYKKVSNSLDIFVYITQEEYNATFEDMEIDLILSAFKRGGKMDSESYDYLYQKNTDYHNWIDSEIARFKKELHALNEKGYSEALKELEKKYQENTK